MSSRKLITVQLAIFFTVSMALPRIASSSELPPNWPWRGIVITSASSPDADDIAYLARINVNVIELHLDVRRVAERFNLSPSEAWKRDLQWADRILNKCKKHGITGILSMVQIPVDPALGITQESPEFWENPERLKEAVDVSRKLAEHFKNRGKELGAYVILSEPGMRRGRKVERPAAWPALMKTIVKTIRQYDPKRFIMVTPGPGGMAKEYKNFKPLDDPYIIYDAHMYTPHAYTHQGIDGRPLGSEYPGTALIRYWNKKALEYSMDALIRFQKRYNVPVFIGEFSAARWAPGANDYLKDLISIFDSYGWGWAYFSYGAYHGWDPDYDTVYSSNEPEDWKAHYAGRDTGRWAILKEAYKENKKTGAARS